MTIHSGDDFAQRGPKDLGLDLGPNGQWPRPQTPRLPVTLRNKKRAVTADPDDDTFECEKCHGVFDINDSIKTSKKSPMLCPACSEENLVVAFGKKAMSRILKDQEWDQASADSTNMSMLEQGRIQPGDL